MYMHMYMYVYIDTYKYMGPVYGKYDIYSVMYSLILKELQSVYGPFDLSLFLLHQ